MVFLIRYVLHDLLHVTAQYFAEHIDRMRADALVSFHSGDLAGADVVFVDQRILRNAVFSLKAEYPEIRYYVVLAYMPNGRNRDENHDYTETIYPEGLESVPKRFAIMYRNRWMINNANAVICHISHSWGGACQAVSLAERKKLKIDNLA